MSSKQKKGEVRRNRGHLKAITKFGTSLEIETPQSTETGQSAPTRPQREARLVVKNKEAEETRPVGGDVE